MAQGQIVCERDLCVCGPVRGSSLLLLSLKWPYSVLEKILMIGRRDTWFGKICLYSKSNSRSLLA